MTDKAERALKAQQKAQDLFTQYVTKVRRQITRARMIEGDEVRAAMLEAGLAVARRDMEDLELELGALLLSQDVTDDIIAQLTDAADRANDLLDQMEDIANILDKVEQGAKLISGVLKTVTRVL
ncbi:hypothetical protein [Pontixanthobacter aquaemixtae]|uniref:Uncharacterized protein n=1 Tax=Pontixanthobacter aquaemixtae TaxID=1958940 RepID=A0A844ZZI8_9SPHN|nr:hypothetical protein [Pontixanthobacter aquaemixtae]MXO90849.1 hypothetical protein [Pontixanthobacter aquaemixtae]